MQNEEMCWFNELTTLMQEWMKTWLPPSGGHSFFEGIFVIDGCSSLGKHCSPSAFGLFIDLLFIVAVASRGGLFQQLLFLTS